MAVTQHEHRISQLTHKRAGRVPANAGGTIDPRKQSAQEVAGNLQQPLQDSAEQLKSAAGDATNKTADHAKSAAADVQQPRKQ